MILIIPGYLAVSVLRYLGSLESTWTDQDKLYYGVGFSVVIYFFVAWFLGAKDFEVLKSALFSVPVFWLVVAAFLILGVVPGLCIKMYIEEKGINPRDVWSRTLNSAGELEEGCWVLVYTSDGKEFKGSLKYFDTGNDANSITIINPRQVIRNDKYEVINEFPLTEEILFTKENISRIAFFTEV